MPSRLKSARAAPRDRAVHDPGLLGHLGEGPIRVGDEEVVGIPDCIAGLRLDISLGHEEVDEGVVVDVLELDARRSRGRRVAHIRSMGGQTALKCDVDVIGLRRPLGQVCNLLSP